MPQMDYEPYAGIIQRALQARGTAEGDLARDRDISRPAMSSECAQRWPGPLLGAAGAYVALDEVIRLERTCTGATTPQAGTTLRPARRLRSRLRSTIPRRVELRARRSAPRY